MAKKTTKKTEIEKTEVRIVNQFNLEERMKQYPNVSLRKLALATNISYGWLLKKSKEPIPGKEFDPAATNWEAVMSVFNKRDFDLDTLDWNEMNQTVARKSNAALLKNADNFEVGMKVYLREDNVNPYEICYLTDTHVVIMKVGSTEPRALSHATFLMKGPALEPRTVTEKITEEEEA